MESIIENKNKIDKELLNYYKKQNFILIYQKDNLIKTLRAFTSILSNSDNSYVKGYNDAIKKIIEILEEDKDE